LEVAGVEVEGELGVDDHADLVGPFVVDDGADAVRPDQDRVEHAGEVDEEGLVDLADVVAVDIDGDALVQVADVEDDGGGGQGGVVAGGVGGAVGGLVGDGDGLRAGLGQAEGEGERGGGAGVALGQADVVDGDDAVLVGAGPRVEDAGGVAEVVVGGD